MVMRVDHERFHKILTEAQWERSLRNDWVESPDGPSELGWVIFERETMHRAVNQVRGENGLAEISVEHVKRVERMATGHSDYTFKYALYCAELAADIMLPAP
jgi:phosphopantetheine adenylyltransferase